MTNNFLKITIWYHQRLFDAPSRAGEVAPSLYTRAATYSGHARFWKLYAGGLADVEKKRGVDNDFTVQLIIGFQDATAKPIFTMLFPVAVAAWNPYLYRPLRLTHSSGKKRNHLRLCPRIIVLLPIIVYTLTIVYFNRTHFFFDTIKIQAHWTMLIIIWAFDYGRGRS